MFPTIYLHRTVTTLFLLSLLLSFPSFALGKEIAPADAEQVGKPLEEKFTGRVVLASDPEQGVSKVEIFAYSIESRERRWLVSAKSDESGHFEGRVLGSRSFGGPGIVRAFNHDSTLGTIRRIDDEKDVVLELAPTATIYGNIIDDEIGEFAANRAIRLYYMSEHGLSIRPIESTTDGSGHFNIQGLVPGYKYHLCVETAAEKVVVYRPLVATLKAESAEKINLDALHIPKAYHSPTLEEFVALRYLNKPADERFKRGLKLASLGNVRLLVIVMERDNAAAKEFYKFLYDQYYGEVERDEKTLQLLSQFVFLSIAASDAQVFIAAQGIRIPANDDGMFAVLDSTGKVIAETSFAKLKRRNDQFAPSFLADFLEPHLHPSLPNAREALNGALTEAQKENKRVFIQVGGPGCGPCYLLAEYFDEHETLFRKDYVLLKLDLRMADFKEVNEKLTNGKGGGAPWMTILDSEEKTLITGDTEEGNIGFPVEGAGLKQFERMLMTTRQNLTDDEISSLITSLQKKGEEIQKNRKE